VPRLHDLLVCPVYGALGLCGGVFAVCECHSAEGTQAPVHEVRIGAECASHTVFSYCHRKYRSNLSIRELAVPACTACQVAPVGAGGASPLPLLRRVLAQVIVYVGAETLLKCFTTATLRGRESCCHVKGISRLVGWWYPPGCWMLSNQHNMPPVLKQRMQYTWSPMVL
jgi:hypothetical protein